MKPRWVDAAAATALLGSGRSQEQGPILIVVVNDQKREAAEARAALANFANMVTSFGNDGERV